MALVNETVAMAARWWRCREICFLDNGVHRFCVLCRDSANAKAIISANMKAAVYTKATSGKVAVRHTSNL
jgi:hypothetical protein